MLMMSFVLSECAGIDYSVKTIAVDNSQVALQLWDTAGQERWAFQTLSGVDLAEIFKLSNLFLFFSLMWSNVLK